MASEKPTARELERAAEVACSAYCAWLRDDSEEHIDRHEDAMNRLIGVVEQRTGRYAVMPKRESERR